MPPSIRVRLTLKAQEGPCGHCEDAIFKGELHATAVQTFGQSKAGHTKYRALHLHVVCLPKWLVGDHIRYTIREKKAPGRPEGSILRLSVEDNQKRMWLVRTHARLIREVVRSDDEAHIGKLYIRALAIGQELEKLGGKVNNNLVRRSPEARDAFLAKTKHVRTA